MFYLQYALRNFWRNRRWSLFAVFSIAAGVASIVALRSLGLAIGDSLTSNLRASNHGDITIIVAGESAGFSFAFGGQGSGSDGADRQLDEATLALLDDWVSERDGAWSVPGFPAPPYRSPCPAATRPAGRSSSPRCSSIRPAGRSRTKWSRWIRRKRPSPACSRVATNSS